MRIAMLAALVAYAAVLPWNAAFADTPDSTVHSEGPTTMQASPPLASPESQTQTATSPIPVVVTVAQTPANAPVLTDLKIYPSF